MPKISTDKKAIDSFLTRAVENVYPSPEELKKTLLKGKQISIYLGIDPTGPTLHLGHLIPMRKLAELQKLGHKIILLIGDFTAMIGDPTDKKATRQPLTRKQVLANCKGYKEQASKILNFSGSNPVELKFNSDWLAKMTFEDILELTSHFTVQQMVQRDMFKKRIKDDKPIAITEFMYPLMQGYDSVVMDVDMEVGGNDQTFNMMAGRHLMKTISNKEKFVLTTKLLVDPTGTKMGKTEGNMISLSDSPEDMYGKVMSWSDSMIAQGFELLTDIPMKEITAMEKAMKKGENPVMFKRQLARKVVSEFVSEAEAEKAEKNFSKVFTAHQAPEDIPVVKIGKGSTSLIDALVTTKLVTSNSEARRAIEQGGVKVDEKVVKDITAKVKAPVTIQKGKRHFVRLTS
ncbi:tyrosine--tRNA ligase [Patescibacteria group bacterium]|nr:tyrosine--tRNA ligase [Patescibacteria group bacterium]